jgi:hypothetical protein
VTAGQVIGYAMFVVPLALLFVGAWAYALWRREWFAVMELAFITWIGVAVALVVVGSR